MKAYLFPGQGTQFPGMGKALYNTHPIAKAVFEAANDWLGLRITDIMFNGTPTELQATYKAQLAVFLYGIAAVRTTPNFLPQMVAGHSLGEYTALVASQVLTFEDGLRLVDTRARAMEAVCNSRSGTMAAILGLDPSRVAEICTDVDDVVVPANDNCPGQMVISGTTEAVRAAAKAAKAAGAKKVIFLQVGGGFHSPLMVPASQELAQSIESTRFRAGICPIYQNVSGQPITDPTILKAQLIQQLTAPVLWTQTLRNMIHDGATHFMTYGPGHVLEGLVRKIDASVRVSSMG
ncbi:MAG: ACP S-malonyltransferase [Bacteroidota bacterium]